MPRHRNSGAQTLASKASFRQRAAIRCLHMQVQATLVKDALVMVHGTLPKNSMLGILYEAKDFPEL